VVAIAATTHLLTIEGEGLTTSTHEDTHLLHVSRLVLLDGGTPELGFAPDLLCTNGSRRWNHDGNLDGNLNNLGIVPHVGDSSYENDKSHP
jgi:hypothetical protein